MDKTKLPVEITVAHGKVEGDLVIPAAAQGLVIFAHGSGSSRHSPRNQRVAEELQRAGMGTLLMDLLSSSEESVDLYTREHRFDIPLLAGRVVLATDWLRDQPQCQSLPVGYFGASTGAAAALVAATQRSVAAVVSRGGRPDLAGDRLAHVKAPTLLIVGGGDTEVVALNRGAYQKIGTAEKQLEIVPGASHLFEEPGALEQVAALARQWFTRWLGGQDLRAA
ncbi:MAG: dienelactone hydrolase family protein [Acidobacteria bacterium]|nr:dienelactone hydrolase family protein [Acidobacteriota bacterium]